MRKKFYGFIPARQSPSPSKNPIQTVKIVKKRPPEVNYIKKVLCFHFNCLGDNFRSEPGLFMVTAKICSFAEILEK